MEDRWTPLRGSGPIATAKRISRTAGLPLATTYHLLRTLVHHGYLDHERGAFRLGPAAHRLGGEGQGHGARLPEWLRVLHEELEAPVYYGVFVADEEEYVLGTVCAAVPLSVGGVVSAVGVSLPVAERERLRATARELQLRLEQALLTQAFTVVL